MLGIKKRLLQFEAKEEENKCQVLCDNQACITICQVIYDNKDYSMALIG